MSRSSRTRTSETTDTTFRGAGAYPRELLPAARPGDYVRLQPSGDVYAVDVMVPQPGILAFDSGKSNGVTVSANSTSADNEATELQMHEMWLGQLRPVHLGADLNDGIVVKFDQGGEQAPMFTSKHGRGEVENESTTTIGNDESSNVSGDEFNSHLTEFYVFEDEPPYFTFENTTGGSLTVSNLRYAGFQYRLEPVNSPPSGVHVEPLPVERVRDK